MRVNQTRERLAKDEVVYGCGLQVYRSSEIPRALVFRIFHARQDDALRPLVQQPGTQRVLHLAHAHDRRNAARPFNPTSDPA